MFVTRPNNVCVGKIPSKHQFFLTSSDLSLSKSYEARVKNIMANKSILNEPSGQSNVFFSLKQHEKVKDVTSKERLIRMCHILGILIMPDLYLTNGIVGHGRLREVAEPVAAIVVAGARNLVLLFPFLLPQSEHANESVPLAQG